MGAGEGAVGSSHGRDVLPTNVKPLHYDLTLEPDFEKFTYEGTVVIDLDVKEESKSISLNTLELDIHSTAVISDGNEVTSSPKISYNEDSNTTTVSFDKALPAGSKAQLKHTFTGYLNDKMAGFYRSSWVQDGKTNYIASTQMEPTDARRAFPSFDEPALKAQFTITLIADKNHTCLSNMNVASEKEVDSKITGGKRKAVTFAKSPLMSTYLVAFIVGELQYVETKEFRLPVRVYATPDKNIEHGRFSVDLAAKTLAFYEKEFDNKYPLPKMDMVAVPDFSAGAMENWGLVTYRVVDLMFDEKASGASTKQRVAEVVQHELAHQWFGNLVTMDFWDGLWLNEGFATWMSWYSCNKFYPEWKIWENFVIDDLQGALSLDSLRSSHPIEVPVKRADEVNQIFDAISYSKGSCVLRMISKYCGEGAFLEGVRRYIKKHAYGNTRTEDLWAALEDASGKPVQKVMDIWTKYVGYPVVTVTDNQDQKSIHVKQNRFLRTADVKPEEDQVLYPVFLGLRTKDGVSEDLTLDKREGDFSVPSTDFFKLNSDHSSLYRTNYTPGRLEKLGLAAKQNLLSTEDRAGMIADAGALASSGYQKTSGLFNLLKSFDSETQYVVWSSVISRVSATRAAWLFEDEKVKNGLEAFECQLVSEKAHAKGWSFAPNDDHIEVQFKALLFASAGFAGDVKVIKAAQDMFARFVAGDRKAIDPNIRGSVYGIALENGGSKEFDALWNEYRSAKDADERNTALRALGRAPTEDLIKRALELPLRDEVRGQDIYMPISGLRNSRLGVEMMWDWLTNNWDALTKRSPPSLGMFSSIVQIATSGFTHEDQLQKVLKWFEGRSTKGFDRAVEQASDAIKAKAKWIDRDGEDVREWLKANGYLDGQGGGKL